MRIRLAGALLTAGLVHLLGACSGGTEGDGSLRSEIALGLRADPDEGELTFTTDEADCVAERVVDRLGEARLLDLGAARTPLDELALDRPERDVVFDAVDGCIDLEGQIAAFFARDGQVPRPVAACMADRYVASSELRDALFGGDLEPGLEARIDRLLDDAFVACSAAPA